MMGGDFELAVWAAHRRLCADCRRAEVDRPATLRFTCLKGARLLKAQLMALHRERFYEGRRQ